MLQSFSLERPTHKPLYGLNKRPILEIPLDPWLLWFSPNGLNCIAAHPSGGMGPALQQEAIYDRGVIPEDGRGIAFARDGTPLGPMGTQWGRALKPRVWFNMGHGLQNIYILTY